MVRIRSHFIKMVPNRTWNDDSRYKYLKQSFGYAHHDQSRDELSNAITFRALFIAKRQLEND